MTRTEQEIRADLAQAKCFGTASEFQHRVINDVEPLLDRLAAVEKLVNSDDYTYHDMWGLVKPDFEAALGAAVTPTPQETEVSDCHNCGMSHARCGAVEFVPCCVMCSHTHHPVTSTPEAAATVAEKMAVKAAEVAAMSRWSYREALDALMAAAGYFPTPEAATDEDGMTQQDWREFDTEVESRHSTLSGLQRATEQDRLRATLTGHYLVHIICDHERKLDCPVCSCSAVDLGWHESVGGAVEAWADHVTAVAVGGSDTPADQPERDVQRDRHILNRLDALLGYHQEKAAKATAENAYSMAANIERARAAGIRDARAVFLANAGPVLADQGEPT